MLEDQLQLNVPRSLHAIDLSEKALNETLNYVKNQSRRFAEKNLSKIKTLYKRPE